jgi:hypothetical protein
VKATVFGVVARLGTPVAIRSRSGQLVDAYAVDDYELELEGTDIDLDHEGESVGAVVYAEITPGNQLAVVGVVDGALAEIERSVYWSGSYGQDGDYGLRERSAVVPRVKVLGMSLTLTPANPSAQPLRWMPGDVRNVVDRGGWPLSWTTGLPLLRNAVDYLGSDWQVRTRIATRIVDRRPSALELRGLVGRDIASLHPAELDLIHSRHQRPTGPWRHGPRGRVIAVR